MKKKNTEGILKNLVKVFFISAVSTVVIAIVGAIPAGYYKSKMNKIIDNSGYDNYNTQYKAEKTEEYLEQYKKDGDEKHLSDIKNIEDYDKDEYIINNGPAEVVAEYLNSKDNYDIACNTLMGTSFSAWGVTAAIGAAAIVCEVVRNKQDKKTEDGKDDTESEDNTENN